MENKGIILSGMRPTGKLHIGHLSVLDNWVRLQEQYKCYYSITDWHALTTSFSDTEKIKDNKREMLIDWLSVGLDPEKSVIFVQSDVKEHAELHLLFSMITPLSWLERVPTYKDQINQLSGQGKDINMYGFLGYPLLMAADILVYKAAAVPVGEDQLPHLELCREVARRFNYLYGDVFPEPQALLSKTALLPGVDNRKMSKSYNNYISICSGAEEINAQTKMMITDPGRIRKDDPGHPEICVVSVYHGVYNQNEAEDIREQCRKGQIGCVACKKKLAKIMNAMLEPYREKRAALENKPDYLEEIIACGADKAREKASATLAEVRDAMAI